jgi:DNA-binding XRE family transcriptional regulator/mannose-6-phosphate isomerase-like protein (cupin superfamily)
MHGTMPDASAAPEPATQDLAGDIGRRLTAHRARRGLRVADLAREVGVTPSLISQIEHGLSRPSVSTLFALAQALEVPVDAFFREPVQASQGGAGSPVDRPGGEDVPGAGGADDAGAGGAGRYVVRRGNRAAIDIDGGVRWERLTPETLRHLDFFELVYGPGAESNPTLYSHPGTEMVLVMAGVLEISVGFDSYQLETGDSMQFPSSMPHRYANPERETARAVTVILYDCPADAAVQSPHVQPGRRVHAAVEPSPPSSRNRTS